MLIVSSIVIFDKVSTQLVWFSKHGFNVGSIHSQINICDRAKFFSNFKRYDIAVREASVHDGAHSLTPAHSLKLFIIAQIRTTAESRFSDCRFSEEPRFSEVFSADRIFMKQKL